MRTPGEAVALLAVALEDEIGFEGAVGLGLRRVLRPVEDVSLRRDGLGGNQVGVLRHVPRTIDLTLVVDLLRDLDLAGGAGEAAGLAPLVVVLPRVDLRVVVRQPRLSYHQVVLLAISRVSAEHEPVYRVVLAPNGALVGQPLARQRRPLQRVRHDQVVQEGRVLLPDLVLRGRTIGKHRG